MSVAPSPIQVTFADVEGLLSVRRFEFFNDWV
jgi:hypothetical protein